MKHCMKSFFGNKVVVGTELSIKDSALARVPVGVVSCMQVPR